MNCSDYQRLLHLNRPGERTAKETKNLLKHLEICSSCEEERNRIVSAEVVISALRTSLPRISGADRLDAEIFSRLAEMEKTGPGKRKVNARKRLMLPALLPAYRFAYGALVVVLITIFVVEYTSIIRDRQLLEAGIACMPSREKMQTAYSISAEAVRKEIGRTALQALCGYTGSGSSEDRIVIPKDKLFTLSDFYQNRGASVPQQEYIPGMTPEILHRLAERLLTKTPITVQFETTGG
jgi:hypothetical protein